MDQKLDMYENKSYLEHFENVGGNLGVLDIQSRKFKANKIISVLEDFATKKGKRLSDLKCLDIGCSSGLITTLLSERFKEIEGLDTDEKAIKIAREQTGRHQNINFIKASGLKIPYQDQLFDVVICNQVYEHVPDVNQLFNEIYRVLVKDGFCYLSAINKYCLMEAHYGLPFLSWLPQNLANFYLKVTKKGSVYEEKLLSYGQIKKNLKNFYISDYTLITIKNPEKYFLTDLVKKGSLATKIPTSFFKILEPLIPTYIFILTKR